MNRTFCAVCVILLGLTLLPLPSAFADGPTTQAQVTLVTPEEDDFIVINWLGVGKADFLTSQHKGRLLNGTPNQQFHVNLTFRCGLWNSETAQFENLADYDIRYNVTATLDWLGAWEGLADNTGSLSGSLWLTPDEYVGAGHTIIELLAGQGTQGAIFLLIDTHNFQVGNG